MELPDHDVKAPTTSISKAPVQQSKPIPQSWKDSGASLESGGSTIMAVSSQVTSPLSFNSFPNTPVSSTVLENARNHFKDILKDYHDKQKIVDYYVYITSKNAMASIPVESERYKIAFSSLSAIGLTKETLMQTGQAFLTVIDTELNNFEGSFGPTFQEQVASKKDLIQQKQKQMVDLSNQIQALNEEIKQMNDDVIQNENALNTGKSSFERAAQDAKEEIGGELAKINQYIQ